MCYLSNGRSRTTIKEGNGKSPAISEKNKQTLRSPGNLQAFIDLIEITNIHLTSLNSAGVTKYAPDFMPLTTFPSCYKNPNSVLKAERE